MVVVQPNFEPHYEKAKFNKADRYKLPLKIAFDVATKETEYFILPESSFGSLDEKGISGNKLIKDIRGFLNNFPKGKMIVGVGFLSVLEKGEALTPYIREYKGRDGEILYYESYNAAIQVSNETEEVPIYHKSILVPGAEFFPLKKCFPLYETLG